MDDGVPMTVTVLKRDALGRVTVSKDQRETLLDEFDRSGLKGAQFARLVGVNYGTFAYWLQQRRHQRGDYDAMKLTKPSGLRLVEAVPNSLPSSSAEALEVHLPGGASLQIANARQVQLAAQLIKALHSHQPC